MALDMIFPIAFFSALYYKKNMIIKVMLFFFSFLFLVTLFFTYSRGSYFGLMAMGIYLFFNKIKLYKIVLFIIIIFLSFTFLYEGILYRFNKHDPAVMESNIERVALMQSAFKMIKNNYFIFGNG
ncbi:MAG TPA: O-antigen ligase family protein, partial [Chitinivibrionales bacterium]|nr:O-antigen ligase family protein [Chitinivibrionales bacterium]